MRDSIQALRRAIAIAVYYLDTKPPTTEDIEFLRYQLNTLYNLKAHKYNTAKISRLISRITDATNKKRYSIAAAYYENTLEAIDDAFREVWRTRYEDGKVW